MQNVVETAEVGAESIERCRLMGIELAADLQFVLARSARKTGMTAHITELPDAVEACEYSFGLAGSISKIKWQYVDDHLDPHCKLVVFGAIEPYMQDGWRTVIIRVSNGGIAPLWQSMTGSATMDSWELADVLGLATLYRARMAAH